MMRVGQHVTSLTKGIYLPGKRLCFLLRAFAFLRNNGSRRRQLSLDNVIDMEKLPFYSVY